MSHDSQNVGGFSATGFVAFIGVVILFCVVGGAWGVRDVETRTEDMYKTENTNGENIDGGLPSAVIVPLTDQQKRGRKVFFQTCNKCHGDTGAGLPMVGANLRQSKFIPRHTDAELVEFIKKGRPIDPRNPDWLKIGLMPEKGLNPTLQDDGILDVVSYIRTFQTPAK